MTSRSVRRVPNWHALCRNFIRFAFRIGFLCNEYNGKWVWPKSCQADVELLPLIHESKTVSHIPFPTIYDRFAFSDAETLVGAYGDEAVLEATGRADSARINGDAKGFCHWRRVEQAVQIIQLDEIIGDLH